MTSQNHNPSQTKPESNFPSLPAYSGIWCPLQIEPIIGSGERITIAIAAKGNDGAVVVFKTTSQKTINCLAGSEEVGSRLSSIIQISIDSAASHLKNRISLDEWQPPIQNIKHGKSIEALGEDIHDIIWQASGLTSILGASSLMNKESHNEGNTKSLKFWKKAVKSSLYEINETYAKCFDVKIPLPGKTLKTTIDFLYLNQAIDFGVLNNSLKNDNYKKQFHFLQSRLWQLDQLRDTKNIITKIDKVGLMIQSSENNDVIEEIKLEAIKREIDVSTVSEADEAAKLIQRLVA